MRRPQHHHLVLTPIIIATVSTLLPIAAGCSGGGGSGGSAGAPAAPVSQGAVTAQAEADPVTTDFDAGFGGNPSDVEIPSAAATPTARGLRDQLFAVETQGRVRVFDLPAVGAAVTSNRSFGLEAAPLLPGTAAGDLSIRDERLATVTGSGNGTVGEALYLFDPRTASSSQDVTKLDLNGREIILNPSRPDSDGTIVDRVPINLVSSAALVTAGVPNPRVFVASSNFAVSGGNLNFTTNNPGTIIVADVDLATRTATLRSEVIVTTDFNPSVVQPVRTANGASVVLVLSSGTGSSDGPCSVDVIDPTALRVVATIPLGATRAAGQIAVTPDGRRAFIGGSDFIGGRDRSEVYEIDLVGIEAELGNATPRVLAQRAVRDASNPIRLDRSPRANSTDFIASLAVSPSGRYLYAVNFNASFFYVVEIESGLPVTVQGRLDLARNGTPENFENNPQNLVVRPGTPGVDYDGPDIYVSLLNFLDPLVPDNRTALEGITTDKH